MHLDYGTSGKTMLFIANTNKEVIDFLLLLNGWGALRRRFAWHFNNENTFFCGWGEAELVMIDIDCQKHRKLGTLEVAKALAVSLSRLPRFLGCNWGSLVEATGETPMTN